MEPSTAPPPVVKWYRIYTLFMAIVYLLVIVLVSLGWFLDESDLRKADLSPIFLYVYMAMLYGIGAVLAGAYIASFFLSPKPWTWVYHLILICIGLSSPCCMPISIPLLIFWIKDDNRRYFGRV